MQPFWEIVGSNALLVVVLASGVFLLGRIWKNPFYLHLLWVLVLLKLVTPPIVTVPLQLQATQASLASEERQATPAVANPSQVEVFQHEQETASTTVGQDDQHSSEDRPIPADATADLGDTAVLAPQREIPWLNILGWAWGVGIVLFASRHAFRILRFRRLLHCGEAPPAVVRDMAEVIAKRLRLRRVPQIRMLSVCMSPLVWSLGGRAQVFLPVALFERLDGAAQEAILAHELAHVRRKDHWVRLLEVVVTTLFWWHPVVWWAARRLQEIEDQCCDSMVVDLAPHGVKSYATALLDTLDFLSERSIAAPLGATAAKTSVSMARRIAMLKNRSWTARLSFSRLMLMLAVAALPMALAFAADSKQATSETPSPESISPLPAGQSAPTQVPAQSSLAAQPEQSLKQAVAAFNEKAAKDAIGRSQPPLTEREVITAIREWNRKYHTVADQTYAIYKKIADSEIMPSGSALEFNTRNVHDGRDVTVWWIDLTVRTGKTTGYGFRIRDRKIDYRPDDSVERRWVRKLVKDFPEKTDLSTPESAVAAVCRNAGRNDIQAVLDLSWVKLCDAQTAKEKEKSWKNAPNAPKNLDRQMLEVEMIEALTYHEDCAAVIFKSGEAMFGSGRDKGPYGAEVVGRINGMWKILDCEVPPSSNPQAVAENFEKKKDDIWRRFVEVKDDLKNGRTPTSRLPGVGTTGPDGKPVASKPSLSATEKENIKRWQRETWQMGVDLDKPDMEPQAVQWAIFDKDPVPAFMAQIKQSKNFNRQQLSQAGDEAGKEQLRTIQMAVAWDQGFKEVSGAELYLLARRSSHDFSATTTLSSNSPGGKKWIVTKTVRINGKPVCWCIPVEVKTGERIDVTFDKKNMFDLRTVYDNAMADPTKRSAPIAPGEPLGISAEKADLMGRVEWAMMHGGRDITARKTIEWGEVEKDADGNRKIRYKFYATIWDKDVYIMNKVFTFDAKGNILDMVDVEGFPQKKVEKPVNVNTQQGMKELVEDFFSKNYRDITSRETIEWGEVKKTADGNLSIRYKFRAKIWDKDTKIMNQVFTFDPKGKFVSVKDE